MSAMLPRDGLMTDGIFRFPARVYYEDTDAGGIVYHANYLRFAERARSEMLRHLGIHQEGLRVETGQVLVVHRMTIDFLAPARLDDDLVVTTRLASLGRASLDLEQEVGRGGTLLVRIACRCACLGRAGQPARLPPSLRAALLPLTPTSRMVSAHG